MNASSPLCAPTADAAFGPAVQGCRNGFDFTLVFEQSIFVILPAALLLIAGPFRLLHLGKAPLVVGGPVLRNIKLTVAGILAILQLALVALWATRPGPVSRVTNISIAASCISCASSLMSCALSYAEHGKSLRPSSLLNVFLLVSLLLDAALLRTLWLATIVNGAIRAVFSASFGVKAVLVVLEAVEKSRFLLGSSGEECRDTVRDRENTAPEETSGLYGRAVYAWVAPLLKTGFRRLLVPADLFVLDAEMRTARLGDRFWRVWNTVSFAKSQKHRLITSCILTLRWPLTAVIVPRLVQLAFTICQPLVLNRFLVFLSDEPESPNVGYGLVAAYGLVYFGIATSQALYWHSNARFVTMLRGTLVTAVFSKATEISITATDNAAAVTLMSTDVEVIVRAMRQINEFWANIIQIAIGTWLLSDHIGYAAAGPIIVSMVALAATIIVSPQAKKYRIGWLKMTQKRVGITSAMIGHIKSIKMSGLSQKLSSTIASLRIEEIKASRPFRVFGAITSAIAQIPLLISPPVAFAMYQGVAASNGQQFDATRLFSSLSFIILLAQPLFWMFEVVLDLSAAFGAFERIQKFLVEATREEYRDVAVTRAASPKLYTQTGSDIELQSLRNSAALQGQIGRDQDMRVEVQEVSFAWTPEKTILEHLHITLSQGQFAMIVGPVASGKTTLLKGLLGEVPHVSGRIWLGTNRLSWCDQSPWILNQSIRQNIVGYAHFNEQLYNQVIKACDLQKDLTQLPKGDMTIVGSKGLALSGGQKQRVALARAVYSKPEIALFDDLFSGLDNQTAKRIFQNLFSKEGLLRQWRCTIILATQSVGFLPSADLIMSLTREGVVSQKGTFSELKNAEGYVKSLLIAREETTFDEDTHEEEVESSNSEVKPAAVAPKKDDKRRQIGDSTIYRYYFGNIGTLFVVGLLGLEVGWAFLQSFPTIWLNFWTNANSNGEYNKTGYYLGVYTAFQVLGVFWFAALIWFVLVSVAARSGISLHNKLLSAVIRAPLSLFTTTDLGSMTTRFSQDIGMVDNNLPLALVVSLASFLGVIAKAGLLAASSYYVAVSFPFLGALYFYLQRGYLRTSRQLRLLDLEEKAPVYSQFLETLSGLSTLRAFGWSQAAILKNHELVDNSQKPFYLLIMVQRWLVLILDLTTAALALLVVGFAVYLRGSVSVGLTGVSLVQLISLSETLNLLMQFWTSMETSLGAVARIKQFAEETGEEYLAGENAEPETNWPPLGHVVIEDLCASYGESGEVRALDGVSLEIQAGEKVAICGRTGSGKSSLLLTFLKLLTPTSGSITIDSHPITSIPRDTLRRRIITVTQDQFVLPGSIRENIDPFEEYTSQTIIEALHQVGLGEFIDAQKNGLDTKFEEDALSHGQKQLFFVARAVLRRDVGRVVLLDEATSSVDRNTEEMVRSVIETQFQKHTVISIAHRLETVIDYDIVVVLDEGKVVEIGNPRELLRTQSRFKALWNASHHETTS